MKYRVHPWDQRGPDMFVGFDADGNKVALERIETCESMTWIDRQKQEPGAHDKILVWSDVHGVVSCKHDYGDWVDVIDLNNIQFRFWMLQPPPPEE